MQSYSTSSLIRLRAGAELERRRRGLGAPATTDARAGRPSLAAFVEATAALALEDWQRALCERLELLLHQRGQRLLIHAPPQHGKSIIVSQRFPVYALGCDPELRIRLACYNQTHAERFSTVNLSIARSEAFRAAFPDPRAHVPERSPVAEWSTAARREKLDANPSFKALGLGTGFTGLGVDILVIDDPYKDRDDAYSPAINASIWGWWTDVVLPRLNPDTNVVVMFHRWHDDDFAGKLLAQSGWETMRFPAIADGLDDCLPAGRPAGSALSPRYPLPYLEDIAQKQGISFQAMYQGTPYPPSGLMIGREHLPIVGAAPARLRRVRYWDIAAADPGKGDYTVGGLLGVSPEGRWYVEHVERFQKKDVSRNAHIRSVAEADQTKYGSVKQVIERPPGIATESIDALIRHLAGLPVEDERVTRDKVTRFEPFRDQAVAGNVSLVAGAWNEPYIQELIAFPLGKNDDQADVSSGGLNWLASKPAAGQAAAGGQRPQLQGFRPR